MNLEILQLEPEHIPEVVALQRLCFPEPFPQDSLWTECQLCHHHELFPAGQLVAVLNGQVVGSCSNLIISESNFSAHHSWQDAVGGPLMESHSNQGSTLYGADIGVHPNFRRSGIARALYRSRFDLVESFGLKRFGTACRMPDYKSSECPDVRAYADLVVANRRVDRTLTPLLRLGLTFVAVIADYMSDVESGNAGALLIWEPK